MTANLQPLLSRDRYTDEEFELASAGLCSWVVEYGTVPGRIVHCREPSSPDSFYRACTEHDEEAREHHTYGR